LYFPIGFREDLKRVQHVSAIAIWKEPTVFGLEMSVWDLIITAGRSRLIVDKDNVDLVFAANAHRTCGAWWTRCGAGGASAG
jgi:hypothetical protein